MFDGNNCAWVSGQYGHRWISTQKQDTVIGGPMKYIGQTLNHPGNTWGLVFDANGYVYYGGAGGGPMGWITGAHMSAPLNTLVYFKDASRNYSDLASCAYMTVDISHLLA